MLSENSDTLQDALNLLKPYGLSETEGIVYLYLLQNGYSSALTLSKKLKLARTKVYRLLEILKDKQLLETKVTSRGATFGAVHPQKFQQLIANQEQFVTSLKQTLPTLVTELTSLLPHALQTSKVLYYEGIEGLKQVSYNITRARKLLRVIEMDHLSEFMPLEFAEMVRRTLVENKVTIFDLTNQKSFKEYTNVTELIQKYSQCRYIPPAKLKINYEVLIYNNVYATYSFKEKSIFCVEIYNEQLAEMQKQIFDFMWNTATPLRYTNLKGAAKV